MFKWSIIACFTAYAYFVVVGHYVFNVLEVPH